MLAVIRAVLVIDPACFKSSVKSFNVLFFQPLPGKSLVSLTASQHLANYNFFNKKIISSILKLVFYLMTSELSSASLPWQRLQLVLCHINNFYGKVSSVHGQLLVSNIIDTVQFGESYET